MALIGVVKSYNGAKGFGFINSDASSSDIFFVRKDLPGDAAEVQGKFLEGRNVMFSLGSETDGRMKASNVKLHITGAEGETVPGKIKSFAVNNGYGFIESSSISGDVRFDAAMIAPHAPPGADMRGKLVIFKYQELQDGKLRATAIEFQCGKVAQGLWMTGAQLWGGPMFFQQSPMKMPTQPQMAMQGTSSGAAGKVKSYNPTRGFGFINYNGQDVKFGTTDIVSGNVIPGANVHFNIVADVMGRLSATQVSVGTGSLGIKRPAPLAMGGSWKGGPAKFIKGNPTTKVHTTTTGRWLNGTLKSFNAQKGFGFISSPDLVGDVFFMKTDLPPNVSSTLFEGQSLCFELSKTVDGKMRAQSVQLASVQ